MLGGTFDEEWLKDAAGGDGTVVIWPGSLITRRHSLPFLVNADGSHTEVDGTSEASMNIDANPSNGFLVYRDGGFTLVAAGHVGGAASVN